MIANPCRRFVSWSLMVACLLCSSLALAGKSQDDAARAAARSAGYEGIKAYESGDMTVAVDKLGRAFNVVKVPTLGLWYARALAKTGNLVEAFERYQEVTRIEVREGKVKEQKQAQADAATEAEVLKSKIPTLTLTVQGATAGCELTLDGALFSMDLVGMATPINPGTHRVGAKQGAELAEQSVTLAEGEKKTVEFKLKAPGANTGAADAGAPAPGSTAAALPKSPSTSSGSLQKTLGWVALGLGGVATVAGTVTGVLVLSKRGQLDDSHNCIGTVCDRGSVDHDQLDSYNQMRTVSTASFVVGIVGLGVGTTLLLTAPKPKENAVSAWLGVGSVGVKGDF